MSRISILQVPSSLDRHRQNDMEPAAQVLLELDLAARLRSPNTGAVAATAGNAAALIDLMPAEHRMPEGLSWGEPWVHCSIRVGGLAFDGPGLAPSQVGARGPVELLVECSSIGADDIGARS
jgi:hypothetical protein